ncbi:MAG: DUF983 domain-containing protein [Pseudomonadota bacterium]|nr:DUF983 domain-containing protein [Pseudomonadota bacterium]MDE3038803.1 DUF983 domain-containing protein [Pseudomonadota bacterium]
MKIFRCPACGKGKLFRGALTVAERCGECGLSFQGHEQGDGPAFFAILIIGALTAIGAAVVEIKFEPPFWLHAVLWIPFVLVGSVLSLRFLKAALIAVQYRVKRDDFEQ